MPNLLVLLSTSYHLIHLTIENVIFLERPDFVAHELRLEVYFIKVLIFVCLLRHVVSFAIYSFQIVYCSVMHVNI